MKCVDIRGKVNKACNLMMYLVLNHHGEKAMLKDPRGTAKLVGCKSPEL